MVTVLSPSLRYPAASVVTKGTAGRTLSAVVSRPRLSPRRASKRRLAEPSSARARTRKTALPSRSSGTASSTSRGPRTSRCFEVSRLSLGRASLPEPVTRLASPTETSSSSPGAAKVGAFGLSTKSPRTTVFFSKAPMAASEAATAITRSVPLQLSGTW